MLITEINIKFKAGDGGNGKVSFYKNRKGPDGGNGGKGGSIFINATSDIYALSDLSKNVKIEAENGQHGMSNKKDGKFAAMPKGDVLVTSECKLLVIGTQNGINIAKDILRKREKPMELKFV